MLASSPGPLAVDLEGLPAVEEGAVDGRGLGTQVQGSGATQGSELSSLAQKTANLGGNERSNKLDHVGVENMGTRSILDALITL